jgi:hypothetical protein
MTAGEFKGDGGMMYYWLLNRFFVDVVNWYCVLHVLSIRVKKIWNNRNWDEQECQSMSIENNSKIPCGARDEEDVIEIDCKHHHLSRLASQPTDAPTEDDSEPSFSSCLIGLWTRRRGDEPTPPDKQHFVETRNCQQQ